MKSLSSALILPETEPAIHGILKLLFFFNSLSYYLATETDAERAMNEKLLKDICTGYAPAPLHEDLGRFNRLIGEMANSRPDDLSRLFSSEQSPIATGEIRDRDESSAGRVVAALHTDDDKEKHARHRERLWQARLILKLAEILDRREREIINGMVRISKDEKKIFNSLEGLNGTKTAGSEQSPDFDKLEHPKKATENYVGHSPAGSSTLVPIRIKAWTELFLTDSSPDRPFILVTLNSECGNTILDRYENIYDRQPQKLFSLPFPSVPGPGSNNSADEHYTASRKNFRLAAEESLKYFENFLRETALSTTTSPVSDRDMSKLAEHITAWEKVIQADFPGTAPVNKKLAFYSFPGITPASLLQRLFHLEPPASNKNQDYATCILAVLRT